MDWLPKCPNCGGASWPATGSRPVVAGGGVAYMGTHLFECRDCQHTFQTPEQERKEEKAAQSLAKLLSGPFDL